MPEDLVAVLASPDHDDGLWEAASAGVAQHAAEGVRTLCIQIKLQAAHVGDIGFLSPLRVLPERIHSDEDVVTLGIQVAEPSLETGVASALGVADALMNGVRLSAHGENGDAVAIAIESP